MSSLLLCAAAAGMTSSGTLLALSQHEAPAGAQRTLTLEERVSYQRAIEEVYWRHRIWPKENANPKPSLDAVMSQAQLEKKVENYLRNSQALEDYRHRPITAVQLQAEMDRMAQHTKQPEVLQELFEALGNDPFVIAECLARPALAERLITNWYAYDQRIHGELKQRVEAELQASRGRGIEQMKQLGAKYNEIDLVRSNDIEQKNNHGAEHSPKLNSREWDETVEKLATAFGMRFGAAENHQALPIGQLSLLQEDERRYYATAVLSKSNDRLKLATVSWSKEPLEAWLARGRNQVDTAMRAAGGNYTLPKISEGGCVEDTWTDTAGAPSARGGQTAVWTGTEMIIWGSGWHGDTSGGRYNPSTDTWVATNTTNAPEARSGQTAVWTGSEMIIWGGSAGGGLVPPFYFITGGRYNPITDSWIATSTTNTPEGRASHTAIWTGSEMIIWGGAQDTDFGPFYFNTGGRYNPSTNTWAATSTTNAPEARGGHTAVWTGGEMLVWGGANASGNFNTGGIYNPNLNGWAVLNTANAPTARAGHTAVWTGADMIVWGSSGDTSGGRYHRGTNSWTATSTVNAPEARAGHTAVWTGTEMIVWGGSANFDPLNTGGRYNPGTNSWTATTTFNAPTARGGHTAVWTGTEMIVWGATTDTTGGRYDPNMDSWAPTAAAPAARDFHTAVWTGSEMIVWGGSVFLFSSDTGGRYNLSTDSWAATSITDAPDPRYDHTAVWTGSEMIVWGGWGGAPFVNTGGKYNPISDSWTATTTANAPTARYAHTALWTGSEMIVWGGDDVNFDPLNTGGRYDPSTNSWAATSTTNAPSARDNHTAVWTGSEMIVWGGAPYVDPPLNSGSKYDPGSDSWTATTTANAPGARSGHTAVWTGSEMIVWGGMVDSTGGRYNPGTDSWAATSITNTPGFRVYDTAVWTGSEMIIWGGFSGIGDVTNTGGRYDPNTDSWAPTSITNAPVARQFHTAVWTGHEMIVWGGDNLDFNPFSSGGRYCAPTPTPGCTVTSTTCGRIIVGTAPTDFTVNLSDPADPATVQASDFTVNGTPADNDIIINGELSITFHFNTSPVVGGQNTMHIPAGAFNCGQGPVQEFTCTLFYRVPGATPPPRPRPTPHPRPTPP
jgi:N-acetylneuraminic acid mutarotase